MLKRRMSPDAIVVTQSSSPFFSRRTFWSIERTMAAVFPNTVSYHLSIPAFGIWGFNVATMKPGAKPGAISVPTRYLTDEFFTPPESSARTPTARQGRTRSTPSSNPCSISST